MTKIIKVDAANLHLLARDLQNLLPIVRTSQIGQISLQVDQDAARRIAATALSLVDITPLSQGGPGPLLGKDCFEQVKRVAGDSTCVEGVVFRTRDEATEVYAPVRAKDEVYEGLRAVPGTFLLDREFFGNALQRLVKKEISGNGKREVKLKKAIPVGQFTGPEERCWLKHRIWLLEVEGDMPETDWMPMRDMGSDFCWEHRQIFIPWAHTCFRMREDYTPQSTRNAARDHYETFTRQYGDGDRELVFP